MDENVIFDDKKTHDDWGLVLQKVDISLPTPVYKKIEVPGRDGALDLTEWSGRVNYEERDVTILFTGFGDSVACQVQASQVAAYLHGRKRKLWLPYEPGYYYYGRFEMEVMKEDEYVQEYKITGKVDPFKYETDTSTDEWIWDTFSFENGVIREYKDILVQESCTIVIPGTSMPVVPVIRTDAAMSVTFGGVTYPLVIGDNTIYGILIIEGENTLEFTGNGTITVEYRGGAL